MRGAGTPLLSMYKLKQIYPVARSWGKVATSTPKKQVNDDATEGALIAKDKAEPTIAFGRPPPLPPFFGPLIALSLLETWWSHDGGDG